MAASGNIWPIVACTNFGPGHVSAHNHKWALSAEDDAAILTELCHYNRSLPNGAAYLSILAFFARDLVIHYARAEDPRVADVFRAHSLILRYLGRRANSPAAYYSSIEEIFNASAHSTSPFLDVLIDREGAGTCTEFVGKFGRRTVEAYKRVSQGLASDNMSAVFDDLVAGPPATPVFDLTSIPQRQRWLPLLPFTLCFADPAYDRELGSPTLSSRTYIGNEAHVLAVDRADYDLGATIYFAFWKGDGTPPDGYWKLNVKVSPADGSARRDLGIAGTRSAINKYKVLGACAYPIPIQNLRELRDQSTSLSESPARLSPGDRLQVRVASDAGEIELDVGIVDRPVMPPPAASYGLAILRNADAVATALFSTAPPPQVVDFPDLFGDLKAGHVRRRGLFFWRFASLNPPLQSKPFAYLVKIDRTGGGQVPDSRADFEGSASL